MFSMPVLVVESIVDIHWYEFMINKIISSPVHLHVIQSMSQTSSIFDVAAWTDSIKF